MGEYGREQRNQLSRAIANSGVGSRQLKSFVDNRMQILSHVKLMRTIQERRSNVRQLMPMRTVNTSSNNRFGVTYRGKGSDFTGGQQAGNFGITGVKNYTARLSRQLPTGFWESRYGPLVNWNDKQYHKGHILASAMGGQGDHGNIFRQDGGQNTTGDWPAFERNATNDCTNYPNDSFVFTATLTGNNLNYNQPL